MQEVIKHCRIDFPILYLLFDDSSDPFQLFMDLIIELLTLDIHLIALNQPLGQSIKI